MRLRRKKRNFKWCYITVAPWALSFGFLISSTASAGLDVYFGRTALLKKNTLSYLSLGSLVPPSDAQAGFDTGSRPLQLVSFDTSLPFEGQEISFSDPIIEMKDNIEGYVVSNLKEKGNPVKPVSISMSRRAYQQFRNMRSANVPFLLGRDAAYMHQGKASSFFQGLDRSLVTLVSTSVPTPKTVLSGSTGSGISLSLGEGVTPSEPRANILSSATPVPFHLVPEEVASIPVSNPEDLPLVDQNIDSRLRPNYISILKGRNDKREEQCLAEAVYFEARSESLTGQAAVAQVVLNRAQSGLYPSSICGVVYQNAQRYLGCQFTFACEGKSLRVTEAGAWNRAKKIAADVLRGRTYLAQVGTSTHYHANYVRPYWSKKLNKMDVIGRHIFYKLKPGQR